MIKDELKIVRWVQMMRCTDVALKRLFTPEQWAEIEKEAKFKQLTFETVDGKEEVVEVKPTPAKPFSDAGDESSGRLI